MYYAQIFKVADKVDEATAKKVYELAKKEYIKTYRTNRNRKFIIHANGQVSIIDASVEIPLGTVMFSTVDTVVSKPEDWFIQACGTALEHLSYKFPRCPYCNKPVADECEHLVAVDHDLIEYPYSVSKIWEKICNGIDDTDLEDVAIRFDEVKVEYKEIDILDAKIVWTKEIPEQVVKKFFDNIKDYLEYAIYTKEVTHDKELLWVDVDVYTEHQSRNLLNWYWHTLSDDQKQKIYDYVIDKEVSGSFNLTGKVRDVWISPTYLRLRFERDQYEEDEDSPYYAEEDRMGNVTITEVETGKDKFLQQGFGAEEFKEGLYRSQKHDITDGYKVYGNWSEHFYED